MNGPHDNEGRPWTTLRDAERERGESWAIVGLLGATATSATYTVAAAVKMALVRVANATTTGQDAVVVALFNVQDLIFELGSSSFYFPSAFRSRDRQHADSRGNGGTREDSPRLNLRAAIRQPIYQQTHGPGPGVTRSQAFGGQKSWGRCGTYQRRAIAFGRSCARRLVISSKVRCG